MKAFIKKYTRSIALGFLVTAIGLAIPALFAYLWALPQIRAAILHYWWAPFSAAYTIGSMIWTVRAERTLRKLKTEQKICDLVYADVRQELDEIQGYLEENCVRTLRKINVIPIRKNAT